MTWYNSLISFLICLLLPTRTVALWERAFSLPVWFTTVSLVSSAGSGYSRNIGINEVYSLTAFYLENPVDGVFWWEDIFLIGFLGQCLALITSDFLPSSIYTTSLGNSTIAWL